MESPTLPPRTLHGWSWRSTEWRSFLLLLFLAIFTQRAWLVERYAASVAMVDEWEATAGEILAPWNEGTLTPAALFQAHNGDHRIVATRLLEIACYSVNGAWDPQFVLTVKAGVYALAATLLVHLLAGALGARRHLAAVLLAALLAFPFNYQNLIWAFQSQFDFFLLAVAAGWLLLLRQQLLAALAIAFAALFTMGAGPALAASYGPFLAWRAWREPRCRRPALAGLAAALAVAALGVSLRSASAAPAASPAMQAETFASALGWPYSNLLSHVTSPRSVKLIPAAVRDFPSADDSWARRAAAAITRHPGLLLPANLLVALIQLLPSLALALWVWRRRALPASAAGPLALAGFALIVTVATAMARGGQTSISVRYLDLIALNGFAALASAFVLLQTDARWRRRIVLWGLCLLPGYLAIMAGTWAKLGHRMPAYWLANLQADFAARQSLPADNHDARWPILESTSVTEFVAFLDEPRVAAVLPPSVTRPAAPLPWASSIAHWVRVLSAPLAVLLMSLILRRVVGQQLMESTPRLRTPA